MKIKTCFMALFSHSVDDMRQEIIYRRLVALYSGSILAWFVAWLFMGDATWWLVLVNRVVPLWFSPIIAYGVWAVLIRRTAQGVPLLVPLAVFIWLYAPYLLPRLNVSK